MLGGHISYISNKWFTDLDRIEIGDMIAVLDAYGNYEYEVTRIFVVDSTDLSILDDPDNQTDKVLRLFCCTKDSPNPTHRLVVEARLVKTHFSKMGEIRENSRKKLSEEEYVNSVVNRDAALVDRRIRMCKALDSGVEK